MTSPRSPERQPRHSLLSPLRLRLLGMVAIATIPVAMLVTKFAVDERQSTLVRAREDAMRLLDSAVVEQRQVLRAGRDLLHSIALHPEILRGSPEVCSETLRRLLDDFADFEAGTRLSADGRVDCSSTTLADSAANPHGVSAIVQKDLPWLAERAYYRVSSDGRPIATIVEKVETGGASEPLHVSLDARLDWLREIALAMPPQQGSMIAIVDASGFIYARVPDEDHSAGRRHPPSAALAAMLGTPSGFVEGVGRDSVHRLYVFRDLPAANASQVLLMIGTPTSLVYADARRHLQRNLLVAAITLLLALAAAWVSSDLFVIRDVRRLLHATQRLAEGDLSTRVPVGQSAGELLDLAVRFNDMAQRLEDRRREFVALGDSSPDAILRVDRDLRVDWVNAEVVRWLGAPLESIVGRSVAGLGSQYPLAERVLQRIRDTIETGRGVELEENVINDRGDIWLDLRIVPQCSSSGDVTHTMVIARDVTARKRLEAHLAQSERLDSIGKLAGSVAHDFNNLLTAIIGNAELAVRSLEPGSRVRGDVTEILDVSRRASSLTRQLLSFARQQPTRPVPLDVQSFVTDAAPLLRRLTGSRITLELALDSGAAAVRFDPTQLEQVVVNLVTNARDAMPGGGTLRVSTEPAVISPGDKAHGDQLAPGEYVLLTVSDTGIGMPQPVQQRIFEPFFSTKRDRDGTGLGLAVVYGIVRQHGGHIEVNSSEGQGTAMRLFLPATSEKPEPLRRVESPLPAPTGRETILLVEDQDPVRSTIARMLRSHGYSVIEARDGMEVVQRRQRGELPSVNLIVTDLAMPRMGGEALVASLRQEKLQTPVLVISGYDEGGRAREMVQRGEAMAVLEKPFEIQPLLTLVRDLLDGKIRGNGLT